MPFFLERKEKRISGRLLRGAACRNHRPIAFGRETCLYAKGTKEAKKIALQKENLVRVIDVVQWKACIAKNVGKYAQENTMLF